MALKNTIFKDKNTTIDELVKGNRKLFDIINNSSIVFGKNSYVIKSDSYHFLTDILNPNTRMEKTLFSVYAYIMKNCEILSANSSFIAFTFSNYLINELYKNKNILNLNETKAKELILLSINKIKTIIENNSIVLTEEKIDEELKNICNNDVLYTSVKEAIKLSGLQGTIHIEDGKQNNYLVELKSGYHFNLDTYNIILKNSIWQEEHVKVFIVDGIVEKVSELNKIFNKSLETKIPMVIISHGFEEEVLATIKLNNEKGIFNILPIKTFTDLDSINILNDIAVVCGGDILSSTKGEQVMFADYDALPIVEKIICRGKDLCIENKKTIKNVYSHIDFLLKKRDGNKEITDIQNLIDKRIKNLFSHSVSLWLPQMTDLEKNNTKVKIDICLRVYKTLLNYGYVSIDKIINELSQLKQETIFDKILFNCLKNIKSNFNIGEISSLSLFIGIYMSAKTIIPLMLSNGFVELD